MARGLQNQTNISTPDADYPNGAIKDNMGAFDGTPFDKSVYNDIHQFFAKLLRLTGITANQLFDNEYNGFQYVLALFALVGRNRRMVYKDGAAASSLVEADYASVVIIAPTAATGQVVSLSSPTGSNIGTVGVANYSPFSTSITNPGTNNINGNAPPFTLPTLTYIEFSWNSGASNWVIANRYRLDAFDF